MIEKIEPTTVMSDGKHIRSPTPKELSYKINEVIDLVAGLRKELSDQVKATNKLDAKVSLFNAKYENLCDIAVTLENFDIPFLYHEVKELSYYKKGFLSRLISDFKFVMYSLFTHKGRKNASQDKENGRKISGQYSERREGKRDNEGKR